MANYRFFSGDIQLDAKTVCFRAAATVIGQSGKDCLAGIDHARPPVFVQGLGWTGYIKVERTVEYKSFPSKHECDARCMNATGRIMKCECSCGGKNHGRGPSLICEAA